MTTTGARKERIGALWCRGLLFLAVALLAPWPGARGCAVARRPGDRVEIATERAVIIWDRATRTQHFIRRASFRTGAKDFGFLVPTPTPPALAEADALFTYLEKLTAPQVVNRIRLLSLTCSKAASPASSAGSSPGRRPACPAHWRTA